MKNAVATHYDLLLENGNDPVTDPPALRAYMDGYDGEPFVQELLASPLSSVLEIGCGTGRMAERIIQKTGSFLGIDLSPKSVEKAKSRFPSTRFLCGDFLTYPFNERFSLIFSTLAFMHIEHKKSAIEKIFSLLKKSGKFVLCIDQDTRTVVDTGYSAVTVYPDDPQETERLFNAVGFQTVKIQKTERGFVFSAVKE